MVLIKMTKGGTKKIIIVLLLYIAFAILVPKISLLGSIEFRTLAVLYLAVVLWTFRFVPTSIASLIIIALLLSFEVVEGFSEAVSGFVSISIFFMLIMTVLGSIMMKVGIGEKITEYILTLSNNSLSKASIVIFIVVMILPVLLPSALSRLKITLPVIDRLNEKFTLDGSSRFRQLNYMSAGVFSQFSSIMYLSGGPLSILAFQLIIDNGGTPVTWIGWLGYTFLPIFIISFLSFGFMILYFRPNQDISSPPKNIQLPKQKQDKVINETNAPSINKSELKLSMNIFILMILSWILEPWVHIPIIVPPIIALFIFSLPGIRLINVKDFSRNADWDYFILLGTALSIGKVIQVNGTGEWLANFIMSYFNIYPVDVVGYLIFVLVIILLRLNLTSPFAALTFIAAVLVPSLGQLSISVNELILVMMLIITAFMIIPIYSPVLNLVYHSGAVKLKDCVVVSAVVFIIVTLSSFLFYIMPYI
jgi:sodium-dependent dicarboxylate transporter 2/3/5